MTCTRRRRDGDVRSAGGSRNRQRRRRTTGRARRRCRGRIAGAHTEKMRRRWRGIFAGLSFGVFALVVLAIVRSFVVRDQINWSRMSGPEPLSAEARKLLREQRGDDAGFISRRQFRTCVLLRGRLLINWE